MDTGDYGEHGAERQQTPPGAARRVLSLTR